MLFIYQIGFEVECRFGFEEISETGVTDEEDTSYGAMIANIMASAFEGFHFVANDCKYYCCRWVF